jgi:hypothetical protein
MQMSAAGAGFTIRLLIMVLTLSPAVLEAGFEAGLGGTNCSDVKRQITRNWFQLESFFRDGDKGLKRPKSTDLFCVSPSYTRNAMQKNAVSRDMKCYTLQGQKFCCDASLQSCAGM